MKIRLNKNTNKMLGKCVSGQGSSEDLSAVLSTIHRTMPQKLPVLPAVLLDVAAYYPTYLMVFF